MITNERQYKITKTQLTKLRETVERFDMDEAIAETGNKVLAKAGLEGLESEVEVLSDQLREYETLKAGAIERLEAHSLGELPDLLVKARIASGLSQRELAERLGLKEQQIQRYEAEKYASTSLRRLIEISESLGLRMSESAQLEVNKADVESAGNEQDLDWRRFPIKEMYRREWFEGFRGSVREAVADGEHLISQFLRGVAREPVVAFHRKHVRADSSLDEYSLRAWECRILKLAMKENVQSRFMKSRISKEWIRELVKLSARENGPALAKGYLKEAGMALVVEPYLPRTYLDGAAFLVSGKRAIIGMTLRHDRLDNFWFALLHEIAHVVLHLGKGDVQGFFDNLDGEADDTEREADDFAGEALIPHEIWETAMARYVRSPESVKELSEKLGISPAIVAGRIERESWNYVILKEMVGRGKVRQYFPEARFGG